MTSPALIRNTMESDIALMSDADKVAHLRAVWNRCTERYDAIHADPVRAEEEGLWAECDDLKTDSDHAARLLERMGAKPARVSKIDVLPDWAEALNAA